MIGSSEKFRCRQLALLMLFLGAHGFVSRSAASVFGQDTAIFSAADWPMYNHDPSGWRFNPVEKTLGTHNVGKLVEKWRFPASDAKDTIGVVHATPAVVNGEVYFGTATFPAFYKLDKDGKLLWMYRNTKVKSA